MNSNDRIRETVRRLVTEPKGHEIVVTVTDKLDLTYALYEITVSLTAADAVEEQITRNFVVGLTENEFSLVLEKIENLTR